MKKVPIVIYYFAHAGMRKDGSILQERFIWFNRAGCYDIYSCYIGP